MIRFLYKEALENSFAVFLITALGCLITILMGTLSYTTMKQMAIIMSAMYLFCRFYQSYQRKVFDEEYSLLGGHNLEKLFVVLTVFIMGVALYVDASSVMRL
jgi:hypothetical protein